jgi:tyrosinase
MADIDCSAGDPTFYLHHNYIDRVWWQWQQADAKSRMFDVSGNSLNTTYLAEQGYVAPKGGYAETTLEYVLSVADIVPDVQIVDVVNVQGGYLCYEYDY